MPPNQAQKAELDQLKKLIYASLDRMTRYYETDGPLVLIESEAKLIADRCARYFRLLDRAELDSETLLERVESDERSGVIRKWLQWGIIGTILIIAVLLAQLYYWILR